MSKTDEIYKLFRDNFFSKELTMEGFLNGGDTGVFTCNHRECCKVDENQQPIWSPLLGDEDTKVMIIGEAPSKTERAGIHIGGLFNKSESNPKSPMVPFREWVKTTYDCIPYFTDVVKCGVAKQTREEKKILKRRAEKCFEMFLKREIEIIRPEYILCLGAFLRSFLSKRPPLIPETDNIIHLMHYSYQASLPLSIKDKYIIWDWQTKKISLKDFAGKKLTELSYFNK